MAQRLRRAPSGAADAGARWLLSQHGVGYAGLLSQVGSAAYSIIFKHAAWGSPKISVPSRTGRRLK